MDKQYIATRREELARGLEWGRMVRHIGRLRLWLSRMEPSLALVMDPFDTMPDPFTAQALDHMHASALKLFDEIVRTWPGTKAEKWALMDKTPFLAFYFGFARRPLTDLEEIAAETAMVTGRKPTPDPRVKVILEPGTDNRWHGASELAVDLGCAPGTLYNHLSYGKPATIFGRSFIYDPAHDPDAPLPGSFNAMTDAERAQLRQQTIDAGFKPRF